MDVCIAHTLPEHQRTVRFGAVLLVALCLLQQQHLVAQLDDVADDSYATPQFDAIERFREDPLCLPCITPTELTIIPGFGRTTVSRILKAVEAGVPTLEAIADTACLSIDQRVLLLLCTSLNCSCAPRLQNVRTRIRGSVADGSMPDVTARIDVATDLGRTGAVFRRNAAGDVSGGWLLLDTPLASIALGDVSVGSGLGLVQGGGGGFGRTILGRLSAADVTPRLRPWTSTYRDGSQRGIGIILHPTLNSSSAHVLGSWSRTDVGTRTEHQANASLMATIDAVTAGLTMQHLAYNGRTESTSMQTVPQSNRTLLSAVADFSGPVRQLTAECAIDDSMRTAFTIVGSTVFHGTHLLAGVRWAHPSIRNPYASPVSSLSSLGNEAGICLGLRLRGTQHLYVEGMVDVHSILSRSYGRPLPSYGMDVVLDGLFRFNRTMELSWRLRYEADDEGWKPPESAAILLQQRHRATTRAHMVAQVAPTLRLAGRLDIRNVWYQYQAENELGVVAYTDVMWTPHHSIRFSARVTAFQAPSIESAAYTMETPLVGLPRTVAGTGNGTRLMATCRYTPSSWCAVSVAYTEQQRRYEPTIRWGALQVELFYVNNAR